MHPVLALAALAALGILAARLPHRWLWRRPRPVGLALVFAAGVPLVLAGLVLGPGLGVLDPPTLRALAPAVALGVGWIGAVLGSRLPWRVVRRIPPRFLALAGVSGAAALALVGTAAVLLRAGLPALAHSWRPGAAAVLCLGAAAAVSGPGSVMLVGRTVGLRRSRIRLFELAATLDTALGALAFTLALAVLHPMGGGPLGWLVWLLVSLGSGLLVGLLFLSLTREQPAPAELSLYVLGVVLFGSGIGYAANLSPFLVCLVASVVVTNFSRLHRGAAALLLEWEHPLYGVLLVLAGTLLRLPTAWLLLAVPLLAALRIVAKWLALRVAPGPLHVPGVPPNAGLGLAASGGVAIALGINFVLATAGWGTADGGRVVAAQAVFTTIFLIAVASQTVSGVLMKAAMGVAGNASRVERQARGVEGAASAPPPQ